MLESDPELECSLQKYVMESISKQVFSSFNLLVGGGWEEYRGPWIAGKIKKSHS